MDPSSETGLATPSLYHGCSTVDNEDGWMDQSWNQGFLKSRKKDDDSMIPVAKADLDMKMKSDKGSP